MVRVEGTDDPWRSIAEVIPVRLLPQETHHTGVGQCFDCVIKVAQVRRRHLDAIGEIVVQSVQCGRVEVVRNNMLKEVVRTRP